MKKYLSILFVFISISCSNPIEKNTIVFNDDLKEVENRLNETSVFLHELSQGELNKNYYFRKDILFINNNRIGNIDSISYNKVSVPNLDKINTRKFIENIKFLRKNEISSGYIDQSIGGIVLYTYRDNDDTYNDIRHIVLIEAANNPNLKVLDKKRNLLLVAYNDARIR